MLARIIEQFLTLFAALTAAWKVPLNDATEPTLILASLLLSRLRPLRFALFFAFGQAFMVVRQGSPGVLFESLVEASDDIFP